MAKETTSRGSAELIARPWIFLLAGLVLLGAALVARTYADEWIEVRLHLLVAGLALAYAGVARQLRKMAWAFPGRVESAAVVSVSGLGAIAGFFAMQPEWTSGRIFFGGLFALTMVGAVLILLPSLARRVALSLIVVFHLVGIVTAVTVVEPGNGTPPWVSQQLMAWVYRPYLNLVYMTNAYHFYSPEPGTSSVLWFAVHYSDGKWEWVKLPDKADCPIGMTYQRLNALPEHSFYSNGRMPAGETDYSWENVSRRRQNGSRPLYERQPDKKPIPMVVDLDTNLQYQYPSEVSQKQIASLARHIWHLPLARREEFTITSVKVYRLKINVLSPYELSKGKDPFGAVQRMPYFLGEFDKEGKLLHPRDPFLYWYLPVVRVSPTYPGGGGGLPYVSVRVDPPKDSILLDCLEMHAATPSPTEQKEAN